MSTYRRANLQRAASVQPHASCAQAIRVLAENIDELASSIDARASPVSALLLSPFDPATDAAMQHACGRQRFQSKTTSRRSKISSRMIAVGTNPSNAAKKAKMRSRTASDSWRRGFVGHGAHIKTSRLLTQ
jgi:hypothetical protein